MNSIVNEECQAGRSNQHKKVTSCMATYTVEKQMRHQIGGKLEIGLGKKQCSGNSREEMRLFLIQCRASDLKDMVIFNPDHTILCPMQAISIDDNCTVDLTWLSSHRVQVEIKKKEHKFRINEHGVFTFDDSSELCQEELQKALSYDTSKQEESFTAQFGLDHDRLSIDGDLALRCLDDSSRAWQFDSNHDAIKDTEDHQ